MGRDAKISWKKDFELPVGVSLSARRQIEVMTAKLGSTPERNLSFRCERYVPACDDTLFLGQSVDASSAIVFASAQQQIATTALLETELNQQVTVRLPLKRVFARCMSEAVATCLIVPRAAASCRLVMKALLVYRNGLLSRLLRLPVRLAFASSLRRDLLQIKRIAEAAATNPRIELEPPAN